MVFTIHGSTWEAEVKEYKCGVGLAQIVSSRQPEMHSVGFVLKKKKGRKGKRIKERMKDRNTSRIYLRVFRYELQVGNYPEAKAPQPDSWLTSRHNSPKMVSPGTRPCRPENA